LIREIIIAKNHSRTRGQTDEREASEFGDVMKLAVLFWCRSIVSLSQKLGLWIGLAIG